MHARIFPIAALAAAIPLAVCGMEHPSEPDFARDVQPILTAHCIGCTGQRSEKMACGSTPAASSCAVATRVQRLFRASRSKAC